MCEPISATLAALGTAGTATVVGGVLSGVGSAWAASSERKAEEKSQIAEETRRADQYSGLGEASRYWETEDYADGVAQTEAIATAPALGQRPDQVGSKYRVETAQPDQPTKRRWQFNPEVGGIERT